MPYHYDNRKPRTGFGRQLIIHLAVGVVTLIGGIAGGVEIAGDLGSITCAEQDD